MTSHSPYSRNPSEIPNKERERERVLQKSKTLSQVNPHQKSAKKHLSPYLEQEYLHPTEKKKGIHSSYINSDVLYEQNQQFQAENKQLNFLLHERTKMLQILEEKYDEKIQNEMLMLRQMEQEKTMFISEITKKKLETDRKIEKLIDEINRLHEEKYDLEKQYKFENSTLNVKNQEEKNNQIQKLSFEFKKQINLLTLQNQQLKHQLAIKNHELETLLLDSKTKNQSIKNQNQQLSEQIKHINHLKKLQISQLKQFYQNKIHKLHLQNRRDKELFLQEHENQIKKIQNQISQYKHTNQILNIDHEKNSILNNNNDIELRNEQEKLLNQIEMMKELEKISLAKQKQKMKKLFEMEIVVLEESNKQYIENLISENQNLIALCQTKNHEIEKMKENAEMLRQNHLLELESNENHIKQLQSKLYTNEILSMSEQEIMKVKIAQLRQADLSALKSYYSNEIAILTDHLRQKEDIILENREKYHIELQKKSEMRKAFDLEVLKLKTHIKDLEIAIHLTKQQCQNVIMSKEDGSALSETNLNKTGQHATKAETIKFEQQRHLQNIITSKDNEIQQLEMKLILLKEHHREDIQQKVKEAEALKQKCQHLEKERVKNGGYFENQLMKSKQMCAVSKKEYLEALQSLNKKRIDEVAGQLQENNRQKVQYEHEINQLKTILKNHQHEIEMAKEHMEIEKQQLHCSTSGEKQILIKEAKRQRDLLEEYFARQFEEKELEIEDLKEQLNERESDLRDARVNYNTMEKKLEQLIQNQGQLRDIENKVMGIGRDNQIISNMCSIQSKRKQ